MRRQESLIQQEQMLRETIQPLSKRTFRFPFHYLRTFLFSVLAIIALPISFVLIMVGVDLQDNLRADWVETTATVLDNDEDGIRYRADNDDFNIDGDLEYTVDYFVDTSTMSEVSATVAMCDLVAWLIIPDETGSEFPLWVNPDKLSQHSCVPITEEFSVVYLTTGIILALLSILRLLRTFHAGGLRKS